MISKYINQFILILLFITLLCTITYGADTTLSGRVTDSHGQPVVNVEITIEKGYIATYYVNTDNNGDYSLIVDDNYDYDVELHPTWSINSSTKYYFRSIKRKYVFNPPFTNTDLVVETGGCISGYIYNKKGIPEAGISVSIEPDYYKTGTTDSNGYYIIPGVPVGRYSVHDDIWTSSSDYRYYGGSSSTTIDVTDLTENENINIGTLNEDYIEYESSCFVKTLF